MGGAEWRPVAPPSQGDIAAAVALALAEDLGSGDLSGALVPAQQRLCAELRSREPMVLCGLPWAEATFRQLDPAVACRWRHSDGEELAAPALLGTVRGMARALLGAERTALNFLQLLSGTATGCRRLVRALEGLEVRLLDTRKTVPGLRLAQKYAVRCGGGANHRLGLYDGILLKENHLAALGSIGAAVRAARRRSPEAEVTVEVEDAGQLREAVAAGADCALLDNFSLAALSQAAQQCGGRIRLEASGGIDATQLRAVAATGVDCISVGALTKHCRAIDLSMRVVVADSAAASLS